LIITKTKQPKQFVRQLPFLLQEDKSADRTQAIAFARAYKEDAPRLSSFYRKSER
jgi:hypothetical protein